jgi:hypothetical protein
MPGDPAIDDLLDAHTARVAETARRVRAAVLAAHPSLVEGVRSGWHSINYRHPAAGFVCAIFPTAEAVQLVFERGAELPDPAGLLTGSGKQVRMLVFHDVTQVDDDTVGCYLDLAVDHAVDHAVDRAADARARRRRR